MTLSLEKDKFLKGATLGAFFISITLLSACDINKKQLELSEASAHTQKLNQKLADKLSLDKAYEDHQDFLDAKRGLIAQEENILIKDKEGKIVWSTEQYNFVNGSAPSTVNPSLWRQEKLNNIHGLFQLSENLYQVRGYDLANMTLIKAKTGWIIVDPLTAEETAKHAFNFVQEHLGKIDIRAIIYTHSHIDHFGGIEGIVSDEEIKKNNIRLIAPLGFMEEATSENILVGLAMGRRASFMYGRNLEKNALGHVGSGLGKAPAFGTFSLIEPNEIISQTGQSLNIDGLEFIFQYTPDSEAPAELTFYLPEYQAFCAAELGLRSMHNLYTLRGAKVRDAQKWYGYIKEAQTLFPNMEVYFGSHNWPMWGNENVTAFLNKQADGYKFIHDQSVRLINVGYTPDEIAEELEFPESLASTFSNRGYYGTLKHNAKAIYQNYMGWYDGNPAHLDALPESQSAARYIKLMGGSAQVISAAQTAFDDSDYRWAAELLNKLVFAEPSNKQARQLLAQNYQQLAYQAESGPWRDVYLSAAQELIHGKSPSNIEPKVMKKVLEKTPSAYFLEAMAVNLDAKKAEGEVLTINLNFEDTKENFVIHIENSVFHYQEREHDDTADASVFLTRQFFLDLIVLKESDLTSILSANIRTEGEKLKLIKFLSLMNPPKPGFNIIEP